MSIITSATQARVAVLSWDDNARPVNLLTGAALAELKQALDVAVADESIDGIVITSTKPGTFVVGGDLDQIKGLTSGAISGAELVEKTAWVHNVLRGIETCAKPVVAALNGMTLGGGYELALACHRRILADGKASKVGLPEAQMGLMPGAGGTQRLPRLIGVEKAIGALLEGKQYRADEALKLGLVDEVVAADGLLDAAIAWIASGPEASQPWDRRGTEPPGGGIDSPRALQVLMGTNAMVHAKTYGNFPHAKAIIGAVHDGMRLPIERGCRIESRRFARLIRTDVATSMLRTLYFEMQDAKKGARRPSGFERRDINKIGVLGAGLMGGGIAFVAASAGLDVVLLDRSQEAADQGRAYTENKLKRRIARGRATRGKLDRTLARIHATTDYADLDGCDVVVEAVFEDREIKAKVHRAAAEQLADDAIIGSNTSTLPITGLSEALDHPDRFIGMHFFSPVERMPLLEVIRGKETSEATLALTFDFAARIGKTPIVVNDSRGFYTSRVFGTYITEGMAMLAEGISPALIENAGQRSGMPMAPLALADEVGIGLMHQVGEQTRRDLGDSTPVSPAAPVLEVMAVDAGRKGRRDGGGFYEYGEGGSKALWSGLGQRFSPAQSQPTAGELVDRFLYTQALEASRCVEASVITDAGEADVGAILGWGFAPWSGGPLSYIDSIGAGSFVDRADELASRYGDRFAPPELLRDMARDGRTFHGS